MEERIEEQWGGSVRQPQKEAEAAPPEAYIEEGLLEGLALEAGEVAVGPEGAVQDALGGGAGEDGGEGGGGQGSQSVEGGPGLGTQPIERIKSIC
jgi:hypothetical protein